MSKKDKILANLKKDGVTMVALCYNDRDKRKGTNLAKVSLIPIADLENDEWLFNNLFSTGNFRRKSTHAKALMTYYRKEFTTDFSVVEKLYAENSDAEHGTTAERWLFGNGRLNDGKLDGILTIDGKEYKVQCKSSYTFGNGTSNSNKL